MARTHGRSRTLVAAALGAALLLAGCSDATESPAESSPPSPTATSTEDGTTTSPTPDPTPTLTEPEPGPDFERTDKKGAVAAAEYFVELYSYTLHSGDPATWKQITWKKCNFCLNALDTMKEFHKRGSTFEGGNIDFELTKVYDKDTLVGGYALDAHLDEAATVIRDKNGKRIRTESAEELDARFELLHDGKSWRLVNILDRAVL